MFCKANEKFKDTEVGGQRMKRFVMCIWKSDPLFISLKKTQQQTMNESFTVTAKLCCWCQPRNRRSSETVDRIKERPVSAHYTHTQSGAKTALFLPVNLSQPLDSPWQPIQGQAHSRWQRRGGWTTVSCGSAPETPAPAGSRWTRAAGESSKLPEESRKDKSLALDISRYLKLKNLYWIESQLEEKRKRKKKKEKKTLFKFSNFWSKLTRPIIPLSFLHHN